MIGDVRHSGLEAEPAPEMYIWYLQNPPSNPFIVVRAAGRRRPSARDRGAAPRSQAVDKNIAAYDIRPMAQVRAESVAQRRFVLLLVAAFGVLALVMAAVGVYGVMALIVSERTAEIGVRLALGAQPMQVLRAVVSQGVDARRGRDRRRPPARGGARAVGLDATLRRPRARSADDGSRAGACCWRSPPSPASSRPGAR